MRLRPPRHAARHSRGDGEVPVEWLLHRVAHGDTDAFGAVYGQIVGPVYGLVTRIVQDQAHAEDVSQEVLLEVWRTASRFDSSRGSAMTWIMTIAHHRAVDHIRTAANATDRDQRWTQLGQVSAFDQVAEDVEAGLEREQVRQALDALTALQREALVLAYYGGYTYQEVAQVVGVPLGTAKTRLRDALIRLREYLRAQ